MTDDDGREHVVYDWSPSGANAALATLMKARGMLTDRAKVEHTGAVRFALVNVDREDDV